MSIRNLQRLKRLGVGRDGLEFARKFYSLASFWDACERADWMFCVLLQGRMLNKTASIKLAAAFAKRSPTRICRLWITKVAAMGSDSDAACEAWAASYASAHSIVYGHGSDFNYSIFIMEMRWQAEQIRRIVGNPFKGTEGKIRE